MRGGERESCGEGGTGKKNFCKINVAQTLLWFCYKDTSSLTSLIEGSGDQCNKAWHVGENHSPQVCLPLKAAERGDVLVQ